MGKTKRAARKAGSVAAKPKRKYVTDAMLVEALMKEREMDGHVERRVTCGFKANDPRIVHPRRTREVTVEMRTGSGTTVRTVERCMAFRSSAGAIRQSSGRCNPAIHHCLDGFYARIDFDIRNWEYERDLKLRVPYAVKENRRKRQERARVRRHAVERGLV